MVIALLAPSCCSEAQSGGKFIDLSNFNVGPPRSAIVGAAIGVVAVTGVVLYVTLHKPSITGCTQSVGGLNSLTDEKDKLTYIVSDKTSEFKAGERVKLLGRKHKNKEGAPTFEVKKIKQYYGPCEQ